MKHLDQLKAEERYWQRIASYCSPGIKFAVFWVYANIVAFVLLIIQFIWCYYISSCEGFWWDCLTGGC